MIQKNILISGIILVAAVIILLLVNTFSNRSPSGSSAMFFPGATEETIGAILLRDQQDAVKLLRKGQRWFMMPRESIALLNAKSGVLSATTSSDGSSKQGSDAQEFPADSAMVAALIAEITKCIKTTLVSENAGKQSLFEVDTLKGMYVEVWDIGGKSLGSVRIGKAGSNYASTNVRAELSSAVYNVAGLNRYAFTTENQRYTDKSMLKFEKNTVQKIAIAKKGAPLLSLARGDSVAKGWNITEPVATPADTNKINTLLSSLSNLMATGYEQSAVADSISGIADPSLAITVTHGSTTKTVAIGNQKPQKSEYWAKVNGNNYLFLLSESDVVQLDKPADSLKTTIPKK